MVRTLQDLARDLLCGGRGSGTPYQIWSRDGGSAIGRDALREAAGGVAQSLHEIGVRSGGRVVMALPTGIDALATFWACQAMGAIAVPAPPPDRRESGRAHARLVTLVAASGAAAIVTTPDRSGEFGVPNVHPGEAAELPEAPLVDEAAPAIIQFTSGSTGTPRGCVLSHRAILANAIGVTGRFGVFPGEAGTSWAPIFHDMGLIGGIVWPAYAQIDAMLVPPELFVRSPTVWLRAMTATKSVVTTASNFALALVNRRAHAVAGLDLDLSSLRTLVIGAEPIDPHVVNRFVKELEPYGLDPAAIHAAWGMAETTVLTTSRPGGLRTIPVHRGSLREGRLVLALDGEDTVELVDLGAPLDGDEVRVVDDDGSPLPPDCVGELEVRSSSQLSGYWGDEDASPVSADGWLRTGDVGFVRDGGVVVVGRKKELIIAAGRNIVPHDVERVATKAVGRAMADAVAFGVPRNGTEAVVIVIEGRGDDGEGDELAVTRACSDELDVVPLQVVFVERGALPRTSSGKLQRLEARDRYLEGEFGSVRRGAERVSVTA